MVRYVCSSMDCIKRITVHPAFYTVKYGMSVIYNYQCWKKKNPQLLRYYAMSWVYHACQCQSQTLSIQHILNVDSISRTHMFTTPNTQNTIISLLLHQHKAHSLADSCLGHQHGLQLPVPLQRHPDWRDSGRQSQEGRNST